MDMYFTFFLHSSHRHFETYKDRYELLNSRVVSDGVRRKYYIDMDDLFMFLSPEQPFPIFLLTRPLIFKITFSDKYYVEDPNITYNFIQTRFIATYQNTSHRIALESMKKRWNWYLNLPSSNVIQIIDQNNIQQKFNLQNFITRKNITLLAFVLRNNNDVLQNKNLIFEAIVDFGINNNYNYIDVIDDNIIYVV